MIRFRSPLDTRKYAVPGEFVLLSSFLVDLTIGDTPYRLAIPRGFITDFASVPKLVQILPGFDVNGDSANAAVLHDYAYCSSGQMLMRNLQSGIVETVCLDRKGCDDLLFDGLLALGYSRTQANIFYAGVRVGGAAHWHARRDGLRNDYDFVPDSYWSTSQC